MAKSNQITVVDAIRDLKDREAFHPFSIVVASGDRYLIENPGNLVEMQTQYFYVNPHTDRFVFIRMNQIVSVEQGNGTARRRKVS